jgi:hypothetical protein
VVVSRRDELDERRTDPGPRGLLGGPQCGLRGFLHRQRRSAAPNHNARPLPAVCSYRLRNRFVVLTQWPHLDQAACRGMATGPPRIHLRFLHGWEPTVRCHPRELGCVVLLASQRRPLVSAASAIVVSWRTSCKKISYFCDGVKNRFARRPPRSVPRVGSDMIRYSPTTRGDPRVLLDQQTDEEGNVRC